MSLWREEATLHHPRDLSHFSATPRDFRKVISLSHFTTATDRHEWKNHLRVSHISRAMPELNNKGGRQTDWRRAHSLSVSSRWRYYLPRRKSEKGIHLKGTEERNHLSTKKGERGDWICHRGERGSNCRHTGDIVRLNGQMTNVKKS